MKGKPAERKHIPKHAQHLFAAAQEQGFQVRHTNHHLVWINPAIKPPNQNRVVSGHTSAASSLGNLTASLRRIGLDV